MKYCANCGKELFDEAVICPGCGTATSAYYKYVSSEKAFPTEKSSDSPTEQKSENCASENPTFNSNTNEAPEPLVSDESPVNSFSDEAPENPVSDESPDEGTYDDFSKNNLTDDTVENTDSDEADSNSSSIQTAKKKVIPKKLRVVAVIAIAIILVVCSALSAVYIYNARHVKGLTFNSVEAMESYANGFYIYDNKILWINDSYYRVCNIKSIIFVADEYINEYNNVKKNCNVYNDRELIEYYLKKTDRSELGFGLNNGTLIDIQTNRKLFAVQGDGILFAFDRSNNGKPIERINVAKMTESSPELKSTLETFRSDYEKAVEEAEEKKQEAEAKRKKQDFENKYNNAVDAREVKYNPYAHLGENFIIKGTAELDDYYNYEYRDLKMVYFCICVTPNNGSYLDRWYIYADREDYSELYEKLLKGSISNITIVGEGLFFDAFGNQMANLVDYMVD